MNLCGCIVGYLLNSVMVKAAVKSVMYIAVIMLLAVVFSATVSNVITLRR